ncbi:MAG TPA: hypothetical protein VKF40_05960 [Burkholderiales bacterium]|nr:hypothetical protein [Burkholderiales bacterium]
MDAFLSMDSFFWLVFVGPGALIASLWIGQILLEFLASGAPVTAHLFDAAAAAKGRRPEIMPCSAGGITAGVGT